MSPALPPLPPLRPPVAGSTSLVPQWVQRLRARVARSADTYLMIMSVVVGLGMGLAATLFRWALIQSHHLLAGRETGVMTWARVVEEPLAALLQVCSPALGGLVVGLLIYRILDIPGGHGVPSVMKAVATGNVALHPSMAIKSATAPITLTSGGSAGPEGPIIEIGAVVGSLLGRLAQVRKDQMGTLVGCGAASGIAAVFNAPMGGVIFALELIMRDFNVRKFAPVVVSAVVASVTSSALLPNDPAFVRPADEVLNTIAPSAVLILLFCLLGVACAVAGAALVRANYAIADRFGALPLPRWIKPALGGLAVGIIGLWAPGVLGEGYETVNEMILARGAMPGGPVVLALVLLGLCALKIVASALTLGSGGTGGAFAPSMVCGALVGGAFGLVANELVPTFAPDYRIFALVGMAGVVGSAIGAPLAAMLIIYEVCGGRYVLVLPLMLTVAISSLVSGRLRRGTVYTMSLLRDGFDVEADHRDARDPLKEIPVSSIMTVHHAAIRPADPLARVIDLVERTDQEAYVVLNDAGELAGVISTNDLRGAMNLGDLGHAAIIAQDIANPNPRVLLPGATASEALDAFNAGGIDAVVVVEAPGSRRVAGVVFRGAVLRAMCEPARRESSPDAHARS